MEILDTAIKPHFSNAINPNISYITEYFEKINKKLILQTIKSNTNTFILMYLENGAKKSHYETISNFLKSLNSPSNISIKYICKSLEKDSFNLLPQYILSSDPLEIVHYLENNKCCIFKYNSNESIILPLTLTEIFSTNTLYTPSKYIGSLLNFCKIFLIFIGFFLPAIYTTLIYHHLDNTNIQTLLNLRMINTNYYLPVILQLLIAILIFNLLSILKLNMFKHFLLSSITYLIAIISHLISPLTVIVVILYKIILYKFEYKTDFLKLELIQVSLIFLSYIDGALALSLASFALILILCKQNFMDVELF